MSLARKAPRRRRQVPRHRLCGAGSPSWGLVRRTPLLRLSGQEKELPGVAHRQTRHCRSRLSGEHKDASTRATTSSTERHSRDAQRSTNTCSGGVCNTNTADLKKKPSLKKPFPEKKTFPEKKKPSLKKNPSLKKTPFPEKKPFPGRRTTKH